MLEALQGADVDLIGGLEMGAVPLATAVAVMSHAQGWPLQAFFVRKQAKEHGARKLVEGLAPGETLQGKRVVILEDVTTTGGSSMKAIEAVKAEGGDHRAGHHRRRPAGGRRRHLQGRRRPVLGAADDRRFPLSAAMMRARLAATSLMRACPLRCVVQLRVATRASGSIPRLHRRSSTRAASTRMARNLIAGRGAVGFVLASRLVWPPPSTKALRSG